MMKKSLLLLLTVGFLLSLSAQENLLQNGNFEEGDTGWRLVEGANVARDYGFNGNGGLKIARTPGMAYSFVTQQVELVPGQVYQLKAQIRAEGITPGNSSLGLEFTDANGRWLGGSYKSGPRDGQDWWIVSTNASVPLNAARSTVVLYIEKGSSGTAYFDNVTLSSLEQPPQLQFVYPVQGRIAAERPQVKCSVALMGNVKGDAPFQGFSVALELQGADGAAQAMRQPIQGHVALFRPEPLAPGRVRLTATLLDGEGQAVGEPVAWEGEAVVEAQAIRPRGACVIDEFGRAIVDGKPFLPIGLFMANWDQPESREFISDSDFNCLLFYNSWNLRLDRSTPDGSLEALEEALDDLDARGLKTIFSLKDFYELPRFAAYLEHARKKVGVESAQELVDLLVTRFREHPSLLAWYNNDELPLADLQKAADRRAFINAKDPHHPVWGVLCDFLETPFFGSTCDVVGVDPYPIGKEKVSQQRRTLEAMEAVDQGSQPFWAVPQVFNWAVYQARTTPERFGEWIQPRPSQMRGIILLEALRGARGFVFYSFFDLKRASEEAERFQGMTPQSREDFLWHWQECKELATMLKGLSPWLLSRQGPTRQPLEVKAGEVQAASFQRDEDGMPALVIASIGPENVDAILRLPQGFPPMEALYGHARETAPGVWHLSGNDIWGEVLLPRR